ncbi:MAG: hypothetical protein AAB817_00180, partial [Patescibacteria group bacterium]
IFIIMAEKEILSPSIAEQPTAPEQAGEGVATPIVAPTAARPVVATPSPAAVTPTSPPGMAAAPKDELLEDIEAILQDDLADIFETLPPTERTEFKQEGEETAVEIHDMIATTKFKARKAFHLIKKWLKLIPGVNRFFLDQEAKIKTDDIIELADKEEGDGR